MMAVVQNLMESMKVTADQAMDMLRIPKEQQEDIIAKMKQQLISSSQ